MNAIELMKKANSLWPTRQGLELNEQAIALLEKPKEPAEPNEFAKDFRERLAELCREADRFIALFCDRFDSLTEKNNNLKKRLGNDTE